MGRPPHCTTHALPFFPFLFPLPSTHLIIIISSLVWGEYMGNDMRHTWHDTRRFFLYTGEGRGRIYSTRQLGGRGEDDISGGSSHPSFFVCLFWLGFSLLQNMAGLEIVLWLFFFIVRSIVFLVVHHHHCPVWVSLYLSLSRLSLTSPRCLVCHVVFFLLVDAHAGHVSTMCAERDGRDDDERTSLGG